MTASAIFEAITAYDQVALQQAIYHKPDSVNQKDEDGLPPLYTAARHRNDEAVKALIEAGAELDIFACCYLNRHEDGERLLAADSNLARKTTPDGRTPLHFACQKGSVPMVRVLLQHGADVNAQDHDGNTPLLEAAHGGPWKPEADQESISLLLESGADVDLHTAAAIGRPEKVKAALEASDAGPDQHDESGYTALYHAAHNNHLECVATLLVAGADVNLPCEDGQTALSSAALHLLSQQCDPQICRLLIENGAPYDIHTAAALGDTGRVSELISAESSSTSLLLYGFYPADYCVHCGQLETLRILLKAGADPNSQDEWGSTLLSKCDHLPELHSLLLSYGATA